MWASNKYTIINKKGTLQYGAFLFYGQADRIFWNLCIFYKCAAQILSRAVELSVRLLLTKKA